MLDSWQRFCRDHGWTYRLWSDEKDPLFEPLRERIDALNEIPGKADCMRYMILERHGGIYADADTVVVRPFDAELLESDFCAYEHELVRPRLLANTLLGFAPGSDVMRECIEAIAARPPGPAFKYCGPYLLTEVVELHKKRLALGAPGRDVRILPSRHFYPVHWTATPAPGIRAPSNGEPDPQIYTKHVWAGSKDARATPDQLEGNKRAEVIALIERELGIDDESLARCQSPSFATKTGLMTTHSGFE
jgi:hypothetical protein